VFIEVNSFICYSTSDAPSSELGWQFSMEFFGPNRQDRIVRQLHNADCFSFGIHSFISIVSFNGLLLGANKTKTENNTRNLLKKKLGDRNSCTCEKDPETAFKEFYPKKLLSLTCLLACCIPATSKLTVLSIVIIHY